MTDWVNYCVLHVYCFPILKPQPFLTITAVPALPAGAEPDLELVEAEPT